MIDKRLKEHDNRLKEYEKRRDVLLHAFRTWNHPNVFQALSTMKFWNSIKVRNRRDKNK